MCRTALQVVDLGDHILEGHGLTEDSSRTGCSGRARVQLIQLVPDALAHDWSGILAADSITGAFPLSKGKVLLLVVPQTP